MLFVVDHHDWVMPYLTRINRLPGEEERGEISPRNAYATRMLLLLNDDDSTLRPLAIELSSPAHPEVQRLGAVSTVYTPPEAAGDVGVSADRFTTWDLAKAHVAANDTSNNFVIHWYVTYNKQSTFMCNGRTNTV